MTRTIPGPIPSSPNFSTTSMIGRLTIDSFVDQITLGPHILRFLDGIRPRQGESSRDEEDENENREDLRQTSKAKADVHEGSLVSPHLEPALPSSDDAKWPNGKVSTSEPEGPGFQILIPLKIRRVLGLLHVKSYVGAKRSLGGVVRKFGERLPAQVSSSSDRFRMTTSIPKYPSCCFKKGLQHN
ncbi:hypothetical protein AVEN_40707-1 [Araneus ventricosus]|uniref:Uncharacterized protein n=1 Tax=Araneus ventricosus TaxID=182803 RepID=A0A4Y2NZS6_ARAVE|nr:hypothetical protein AVEN_40707-1 [Araneus ventricosus]